MFQPKLEPGTRKSANTDNYYTLLVDHDPAWSDYPPRSASVICSNQTWNAKSYGDVYVVLPEGDPIVGVCAKQDFWYSFPRLKKLTHNLDLSDLNLIIKRMVLDYAHIKDFNPPDHDYLAHVLEVVDQELESKNINWHQYLNSENFVQEMRAQFFVNTPPGSLQERLQWLLNPTANGFTHARLSEAHASDKTQEIWVQAPVWMIDIRILDNLDQTPWDLTNWIKSL